MPTWPLGSRRATTPSPGTHLHGDHCGGNHLFAGKPIYVQRRELDDARTEDDYTIRE
jgi:glyoxylase-like metal-dependent hydrolase (beta-lactamase superfamily II)